MVKTGWTTEFFQSVKGCSASVKVRTGENRMVDVGGTIDLVRDDAVLVSEVPFTVTPKGLLRVQINSPQGVVTGMAFVKGLTDRTALLIFSGPMERVQRRSSFRVDISRPGLLYVLAVPTGLTPIQGPFPAEVLDISVGGCKVACRHRLEDGAIVRLAFAADLGSFELVGQVRGAAGDSAVGVQWLELPERAAERLRKQVLMQLGRYTPEADELHRAAAESLTPADRQEVAPKIALLRGLLDAIERVVLGGDASPAERQATLERCGTAMGLLQELASYTAAGLALVGEGEEGSGK